MTPPLDPEHSLAVSRIGGLVLANAMVFQEVLSEHDRRVIPLHNMTRDTDPGRQFVDRLDEHWKHILEDVNYYPIFHLAREVLLNLTSNMFIWRAVFKLAQAAQDIVGHRAALHHDLMGRIYHRLLSDAKYLGAYYTSIPAATILLTLGLRPEAWGTEWNDLGQVGRLRMADLACGTGTLLMAAAHATHDNYVRAQARQGHPIDADALHTLLAEQVLFGYDVVPSAIHLTASTLALSSPQTTFRNMNLFSLPIGGPSQRLGSIEFLQGREVQGVLDLSAGIAAAQHVGPAGVVERPTAPLPDLDLCVMNPPFTRSVGGNLLFGSLPRPERKALRLKLGNLVRGGHVRANITAGLGAVFVAAADLHLKPGGRLALVLPKSALSGIAWGPTRRLLAEKYRLDYVVASHDPLRWNFSESTSLSEVLIVATKKVQAENSNSAAVTAVNLWRNPLRSLEARAVAEAVLRNSAPDVETGQGALNLTMGPTKFGEVLGLPWTELRKRDNWMLLCAFAQSDLVRSAYHLARGDLWLPGHGKVGRIHLRPLGRIAKLGPDVRDIHDGFAVSPRTTPYPALWGHKTEHTTMLAQRPNAFLGPLHRAKPGRHLRQVVDLWPKASRLLIVERGRLNTLRVPCILLPDPVLATSWWPCKLEGSSSADRAEKALALWFSSSLGFLLLLAHRQETEGGWVKFKKPTLAALPVLDISKVSARQFGRLAVLYDEVCGSALLTLPEMAADPVRGRIDEGIAKALDVPEFSVLRGLLAQEPVVCQRAL